VIEPLFWIADRAERFVEQSAQLHLRALSATRRSS
jgi:hypothetical protein